MERDGSCRNVISKLINFLPHGTEGQEKIVRAGITITTEKYWTQSLTSILFLFF